MGSPVPNSAQLFTVTHNSVLSCLCSHVHGASHQRRTQARGQPGGISLPTADSELGPETEGGPVNIICQPEFANHRHCTFFL